MALTHVKDVWHHCKIFEVGKTNSIVFEDQHAIATKKVMYWTMMYMTNLVNKIVVWQLQ